MGTMNLIRLMKTDVHFVYLSTAQVFDGNAGLMLKNQFEIQLTGMVRQRLRRRTLCRIYLQSIQQSIRVWQKISENHLSWLCLHITNTFLIAYKDTFLAAANWLSRFPLVLNPKSIVVFPTFTFHQSPQYARPRFFDYGISCGIFSRIMISNYTFENLIN